MNDEATQLSNPFTTGGGGTHFENQVQSAFVILMLTGGAVPCLRPWPINKIKLQGKYEGYNTDDFIAFVEERTGGSKARFLAQIKHSVAITEGDTTFGQVIQAAWNDFRNAECFDPRTDVIALITGPLSAHDIENARIILEWARHSENAAEFLKKINLAKFSSNEKREKLDAFRSQLRKANSAKDVSDEQLWSFLKCFRLLGYDLDIESGVTLSLLHSHIAQFDCGNISGLWARVSKHVASSNQNAGTITNETIPDEIKVALSKRVSVEKIPERLLKRKKTAQGKSVYPPGDKAKALMYATLLGSWSDKSDGDMDAIQKLIDHENRTEWTESLQALSLLAQSPIKQKNGAWEIPDRKEAWKVIGPRIFDEHLDRFHRLAVEVLRERDPRIELDENERLTADLRGKQLKHSPLLRKGLADTLALLGNAPKALKSCSHGKAAVVPVLAVREILNGADWVLWASLNSYLPTLAEAAPDKFLDAVESAIAQNPCPLVHVFAQEKAGIMGQNYMTGLLWALETLAWSPDYLQRVTVILGELAALDPGGNWANRPANSLTEIFLPWYPQTCASIPKRKAAIKALFKEQREVGWKLLFSLLPQVHSSSSGCHKPAWQSFIPEGWSDKVTNGDYWQQVTNYSELLVEVAAADSHKLAELVKHLASLPKPSFDRVLDHLKSDAIAALPESERLPIWEALMDLAGKHRKYPDAAWVMPAELIARIEEAAAHLAPKNAHSLYHRLFSEQDYELFDDTEDFDGQQKKLNQKRQAAVLELLKLDGLTGLLKFTRQVTHPGTVGLALGNVECKEADDTLLPKYLGTEDKIIRDFVGNFVWGRYWSRGWPWVESVITDKWTVGQKVTLYTFLPFGFETWRRAEASLGQNSGEFWQTVNPQPYGPQQPPLVEAVERFLVHGRPLAALVCLNRLAHIKAEFAPELAVQALMEVPKELTREFNHHAILELIKWLQDNPKTHPDDLFKVEWAYLPLLDHHFDRSPKVLEKRLAEDSGFFCELISVVFRSEKEDRKEAEPTELEQKIATNAYRLLHNWQQPPGTTHGAAFDGQAFSKWLVEVKTKTKESGHFRIAMSQIGQVLVHTPPDPGGLWIHHAVADALNEKDAGEMRSGFTMKLFNLRGVHGFTAGKEELKIAEGYHKKAEALEENGYQRIATAMRELAKGYERDAEREAQRNLYGD